MSSRTLCRCPRTSFALIQLQLFRELGKVEHGHLSQNLESQHVVRCVSAQLPKKLFESTSTCMHFSPHHTRLLVPVPAGCRCPAEMEVARCPQLSPVQICNEGSLSKVGRILAKVAANTSETSKYRTCLITASSRSEQGRLQIVPHQKCQEQRIWPLLPKQQSERQQLPRAI